MGNLYVKLYSKNFCGQSGTFSTRCPTDSGLNIKEEY